MSNSPSKESGRKDLVKQIDDAHIEKSKHNFASKRWLECESVIYQLMNKYFKLIIPDNKK